MVVIIVIFILGYAAIAFEHTIRLNKAATALMTGILCWIIYMYVTDSKEQVADRLSIHLAELSQILFFLMAAMTIVELIDAHDGFEIITRRIKTSDKRTLLWIVALITFILSAVLNNLTTAIVMVSLVRKLMNEREDRMMMAGIIIIAANAGGVWSPIGDVTTTMLWIGGQISPGNIVLKLFLPSIVCLIVPVLIGQRFVKGSFQPPRENQREKLLATTPTQQKIVFIAGVAMILLVPLFQAVTGLPAFMGMLLGLGIIWLISEIIHSDKDDEDRKQFTVAYALRKIDTPSILFFLGILLAVAALESTGQLVKMAGWLDANLKSQDAIAISLGLLSSIVDNVPLVAASMGMYDLKHFPTDHYFWEFLAYTTGTGGSALIIGSAAGVAAMGLERINFMWYLKRISWLALLGFFSGAVVYILQEMIFG